MERVCAIVVTYNRLAMLKQCLAALREQTSPCDILIVDNASSDGTKEWLSTQNSIIILSLSANTGGAGGFNAGMREAVNRGYELLWIMDDDTLPQADTLQELLEADSLLQGNYGWLSSVALWTNGKECRMNRPKLLKAFYQDIHLLQYGIVRAEQATFVSLFVKREAVIKCGLPIKEFFIWGDDIEYTRRIAVRSGFPCYVAGRSVVTHAVKENMESNVAIDKIERLPRYEFALRNENYTFRQEGIKGFCYYFARNGRTFLRCVGAPDHKLLRCGIVLKQTMAGFFFNPTIEKVD